MALECTFILPAGRNCRCPATRNQLFCRHHAPKLAVPGPPPIPKHRRYSTLARWRSLGQNLQWLDPSEISLTIYEILECLAGTSSDRISELTAGRYLHILLQRLGQVPFPPPEIPQPEPQSPHHPASNPAAPLPFPVRGLGKKLRPEDFDAMLLAFSENGLVPPEMMPARLRPSPAPMTHSHSRVKQ
jgi:hypothetical protein